MSLNAHCGPVDLLACASSTLASDLLRRDSILSGRDEGLNGEGGGGPGGKGGAGGEDAGGARPERNSHPQDREAVASREQKPRRLLQYRLHSTCQLPGKLLSAQPDQARAPADSLEHCPEDGSIYEVSEDPDVWVRGRPTEGGAEGEVRRNRVTSTAVFSGGRGARRVGLSQSSADSSDSTLLVWQLPLALSQ